jgi:hypothetical protein
MAMQVDQEIQGIVRLHRNMPSTPEALLEVLTPYREGLVVATMATRSTGCGPCPASARCWG